MLGRVPSTVLARERQTTRAKIDDGSISMLRYSTSTMRYNLPMWSLTCARAPTICSGHPPPNLMIDNCHVFAISVSYERW
jgi:hypothetical protein